MCLKVHFFKATRKDSGSSVQEISAAGYSEGTIHDQSKKKKEILEIIPLKSLSKHPLTSQKSFI